MIVRKVGISTGVRPDLRRRIDAFKLGMVEVNEERSRLRVPPFSSTVSLEYTVHSLPAIVWRSYLLNQNVLCQHASASSDIPDDM